MSDRVKEFGLEYQRYYEEALGHGSEEEARVFAMRQLCMNNLYFLAYEIFGMKDARGLNRRKRWDPGIHGPICDMFQKEEDTLVIVFRGAMKTTIAKIWAIQRLLRNVESRVGFWSKSSGLVEAELKSIKAMAQNPELMELFPDVFIPRKKGKKGGWEVDNSGALTIFRGASERKVASNEPQIEVWGLTSSVTGRHYDYQYYDDPIDKDNTNTPTAIDKTREWWGAVQAIKEPGAIQKYTGTPWHSLDLQATIQREGLFKAENILIIPACRGDEVYYSFFSKKFLEDQRRQMGDYLFSCQYELDTRPKSQKMFIGPYPCYTPEEFPDDPKYYISVDPSTGMGQDQTGLCVGAVSAKRPDRVYFVEAEGYMVKPDELADLLIDKIVQYQPVSVGIEFGLQAALEPLIMVKLQERVKEIGRIPLPLIKPIRTGGGEGTRYKKSEKIDRTIGSFVRDQRALFKEDMHRLFAQMDFYNPNVQKNEDDILDAAGMMIQTIEHFAPGNWFQGNEIVAPGITTKWFFEKMNKRKGLRDRIFAA